MGKLHTKTSGCEYHEYDKKKLTEHVFHGLDDKIMIGKIFSK